MFKRRISRGRRLKRIMFSRTLFPLSLNFRLLKARVKICHEARYAVFCPKLRCDGNLVLISGIYSNEVLASILSHLFSFLKL